jgi:hypothetical protein
MGKNVMRSAHTMYCPADCLDFTNKIGTLHRVYDTHIESFVKNKATSFPHPHLPQDKCRLFRVFP